ncbi:lipopolysaccharide heptosyltransferase family protein, partial [Candidatus Pelagibacter sp.]|nr:lipopolysaccharide heptosyltransferase family protein [Candidatus Pelagibacter sp.]
MSNILVIKHGSLGDIAQACGAIQDISENHKDDQIHLLTTKPYFDLFKKNPHISNVILDKRLSRLNLIYLYSLMRNIKKYNFSKVYDLQNSSRTAFYKRILFPNASKDIWSSTETTLPKGTTKDDFDKDSVLSRFDHQLKSSGISTNHTLSPDFSWSPSDISQIKNYHQLEKYIVLFPFCSPHLTSKKWPYYNDLISMINEKLENKFKVVIAPGPGEIKDASSINALCVLDNGKALDISQLAALIKDSS